MKDPSTADVPHTSFCDYLRKSRIRKGEDEDMTQEQLNAWRHVLFDEAKGQMTLQQGRDFEFPKAQILLITGRGDRKSND